MIEHLNEEYTSKLIYVPENPPPGVKLASYVW